MAGLLDGEAGREIVDQLLPVHAAEEDLLELVLGRLSREDPLVVLLHKARNAF